MSEKAASSLYPDNANMIFSTNSKPFFESIKYNNIELHYHPPHELKQRLVWHWKVHRYNFPSETFGHYQQIILTPGVSLQAFVHPRFGHGVNN